MKIGNDMNCSFRSSLALIVAFAISAHGANCNAHEQRNNYECIIIPSLIEREERLYYLCIANNATGDIAIPHWFSSAKFSYRMKTTSGTMVHDVIQDGAESDRLRYLPAGSLFAIAKISLPDEVNWADIESISIRMVFHYSGSAASDPVITDIRAYWRARLRFERE